MKYIKKIELGFHIEFSDGKHEFLYPAAMDKIIEARKLLKVGKPLEWTE